MGKTLVVTILVALLCVSRHNCQDEDNDTKNETIDRKQIASLPIEVILFKRLYSNVTLEKLERIKFEENILSWKLDPIDSDNIRFLYRDKQPIIQKPFNCTPNITSCYNLKISNLTKELVGTYLRESESVDLTTYPSVQYHLNAYETPIRVICRTSDPREECKYNSTTNTLTVKENVKIFLTCYTNIYNVSSIPELTMEQWNGTNNSCIYKNEIDDDIYDASQIDPLATIIVDKTCSRTFKKSDSLFTCLLRNGTNQTDKKYRLDLGKIDIKLNITYRPEKNETEFSNLKLNISMAQSNPVTLTCPYHGNPIFYEWRLIKNSNKVKDLSNNKSYTVKDIGLGLHEIECRISVPGDTKSFNSTKFSVNITRSGSVSTANTVHLSYILSALLVFTIFIQAWLN